MNDYLHIIILLGTILLAIIGIYTLAECLKKREDKFMYIPFIKDGVKCIEDGKYHDICKKDFERLHKEGKIIGKFEAVSDNDEEVEEGVEKKEGFGWLKYGQYRSSRYNRGRHGKHWYPYYRYSGYPYWRFVRYPHSSYLKYPYSGYGSPYQTVRYDGDYYYVTL